MERALPQNQYRHKEQGDRDKESDRCREGESQKKKKKEKTGTEKAIMKKRVANAKRERGMDAGEER